MYNAFMAKRNTFNIEEMKRRSKQNKLYVDRYYHKVRPKLIDSYNKRINTFIRKMEEQPIKIQFDPSLKKDKEEFDSQESKFLAGNSFRFKDKQDWNSMFTPLERIERAKNTIMFKEKYGDANIALRSICSQSEYKPGSQFRQRQKSKQINPPMKYTNKAAYKTLRKFKVKNKKKQENEPPLIHRRELSQDIVKRANTSSSVSVAEEQDLTINISYNRKTDRQSDIENQEKEKELQKLKQREQRIHFKELVDLQVHMGDPKNKKILKDILFKCGIYRKKGRRVTTDYDLENLSEFDQK